MEIRKRKGKQVGRLTVAEQIDQKHQEDLQRLRGFRLLDDDFLTKCFEGDTASIELVLQIVLEKPDLKVLDVRTQVFVENLLNRSVRFDILATDSTGAKINVDYSDFRFIPINLSKDHFHETSIQVCRNNYSNNLAQAGR